MIIGDCTNGHIGIGPPLPPPPGTHEQVIQAINHIQWSSARQTDSSHQGTTEGEPNKLDTASEKQAGVLMDKAGL